MKNTKKSTAKRVFFLLFSGQKNRFLLILFILIFSAALSQFTPLAIGSLTDQLLIEPSGSFAFAVPILLAILVANVVNELIKVARRLMVEDIATKTEKEARQLAAGALLLVPLSYFRSHKENDFTATMTSEEQVNLITDDPESLFLLGRLNRSACLSSGDIIDWIEECS